MQAEFKQLQRGAGGSRLLAGEGLGRSMVTWAQQRRSLRVRTRWEREAAPRSGPILALQSMRLNDSRRAWHVLRRSNRTLCCYSRGPDPPGQLVTARVDSISTKGPHPNAS